METEFLTLKEAANFLRITVTTLNRVMREGAITFLQNWREETI